MTSEIIGMGHALNDIEIQVDENFLTGNSLPKGAMTLIDASARDKILTQLAGTSQRLAPGGSAANTISALAKLGHSTCFLSGIGDDSIGHQYKESLATLPVDFPLPPHMGKPSGSCVVLITPDAERTMFTTLGCAGHIELGDKELQRIATSALLYIEGYLLETPAGRAPVIAAMDIAKKNGVPIALAASNYLTIQSSLDAFKAALRDTSILLANESELRTLSGHDPLTSSSFAEIETFATAVRDMCAENLLLAVTLSERGSMIWDWRRAGSGPDAPASPEKTSVKPVMIPAQKTTVVDSTGAGDAYAAGFLSEMLKGHSLQEMGETATQMASEVISRFGPRY